MLFVASLETITLGSIAFFASAVTDPSNVLTSKYLYYIRQIINEDVLNSGKNLIIGSGLIMLLLTIIKNGFKAITNYGIVVFSGGVEANFGKIIFNGFLRMPYHLHLSKNSADLINAVNWRRYLGRSFFQPCLNIFSDVILISIMLVSLCVVQPIVFFIVVVVLGTSAFFIYKVIKRRIDKIATTARNYQIQINKETSMAIQGIKDVKICGREGAFVAKFQDKVIPLAKILGLQKFYGDSPVLILETVGFGMLYMSICIMLLRFDITTAYMAGTMTLLAVTAWKILPAVSQILNSASSLRNALPYIQTQIEYISLIETNSNNDRQSEVQDLGFKNSVEFENVCFSYQTEGPKIIRDLSFTINKGETIGIIGRSGAGKSTLVDLLIGLLKPEKGKISIDQHVLSDDNVFSWLKLIGYVPQYSYIYDGSLAENIAFGVKPEKMDRSLIDKCCEMSSMADFICDLPEKIDTFIGERGIKLSGGQQQRVAIARALYRKPEILLFDEATSSLDTKNEKSIQNTIYSFKGKLTLLIIAHRLSTIEECDKIIWLDKGQIKLIGTPDEILKEYNKFQEI